MSQPAKSTSKNTTRKRVLFAVLPTLALAITLEAALQIVGFETETADPYESFVLHHPLFVEQGDRLRTYAARTKFFHDQNFTRSKPANTKRIFVFGGSTTFGWSLPDPRQESYVNQLGELLAREVPDSRFEMINCGGLSYASYRLVDLVEECVQYAPDLMIIMSGHNEFIEARHYAKLLNAQSPSNRLWYSLRTVRLIGHLSERSPRPALGDNPFISERYIVRDQEEFAQTLKHYRRNMARMIKVCQERDIPLILCTCPSNLLDHAPFHSEPPPDMSDEAEFRKLAARAIGLAESGQPTEALAIAQQVLKRDPGSAIFHYIRGRCYFDMRRFEQARASLILAKETDAFPKRALNSFNEAVRSLALESDLELFDAEALFFAESEHGIPGDNLFLDDCHPTLDGHRLFAEGLKPTVKKLLKFQDE